MPCQTTSVSSRPRIFGFWRERSIALEALRGELTTAQLAAKHGIHQTMVGEWKRQALEGLASVFSGKVTAQENAKTSETEVEELHARIGQLLVERDLLA